jgi:hypothetical protein
MRISYLIAAGAVALITAPAAAIAMPSHHSNAGDLVTGHDVKNGSLTGKDIKNGSVGWQDLNQSARTRLGGAVQGLSISTVTKASVDPNADDTNYQADVSCPAGATAISGGAWGMLPGTNLTGTYPTPSDSGSWTGRISKTSDVQGALAVQVWAVCLANPAS